jgi:hypothetical protein
MLLARSFVLEHCADDLLVPLSNLANCDKPLKVVCVDCAQFDFAIFLEISLCFLALPSGRNSRKKRL